MPTVNTAHAAAAPNGNRSGGNNAKKSKIDDNKNQDRDSKRENFQPLTNKEARKIAQEWGYIEGKNPPFNSHGELTFKHPKTKEWISPDTDGHKGGVWKLFDSRGKRLGTLDKNGTAFTG